MSDAAGRNPSGVEIKNIIRDELKEHGEKENGKKVTFSGGTWLGVVGTALAVVIALSSFLLFIFETKANSQAGLSVHGQKSMHEGQRIVNDFIDRRLNMLEKKTDAALHNTIKIGEQLRVQDLMRVQNQSLAPSSQP